MWISCAVVVGLVVGIVIGRSTEYYTSQSYRPTQRLSESGKTGPATVIISGIGLGMLSTAIPVVAVVIGIIASYLLASGFDFNNVGMGLYGIGIAAVGMLSTLGITLATDAYGPIADNAGGNAEMSSLGRRCVNAPMRSVVGKYNGCYRKRFCHWLGCSYGAGIAGFLY